MKKVEGKKYKGFANRFILGCSKTSIATTMGMKGPRINLLSKPLPFLSSTSFAPFALRPLELG